MKVITWNTNSRTKEETLNKQCLFLDNQFDILRSVHFNNDSFLLYKFRNVIINQNFQKIMRN